MRHEHGAGEGLPQTVGDAREGRRAPQRSRGDAREPLGEGGDGRLGIDQRFETSVHDAVLDLHHGNLHDAPAVTGVSAGRLDVHDGEAAGVERRALGRGGGERPAPVGDAHHPRVVAHQGAGDLVGDPARRPREPQYVPQQRGAGRGAALQVGHGAVGQARRRQSRESVQRSSRRSGRVMQRGPPPPRTSSLPSMVITPRSPPSSDSSPVRRFTADTTRKPVCSSSASVASFRA